KNDIVYGEQESLDDAVFRINKGSIVPIPSSSAILTSFRNFTGGLSIISPSDTSFGGTIAKAADDTTFVRLDHQSLWVGGTFAMNVSEEMALGMTVYYTSDSVTRSLTNRYDDAGDVVVINEEKTYSANNIIYLLGAYWEPQGPWRAGI